MTQEDTTYITSRYCANCKKATRVQIVIHAESVEMGCSDCDCVYHFPRIRTVPRY